MNGKGDRRRAPRIGREEENLRYALFHGTITYRQFADRYRELLHEGKITRDGKVVRG